MTEFIYLMQGLMLFILVSMAVSDMHTQYGIIYPWLYGVLVSGIFLLEKLHNYV